MMGGGDLGPADCADTPAVHNRVPDDSHAMIMIPSVQYKNLMVKGLEVDLKFYWIRENMALRPDTFVAGGE
jgi:hypothetical protein